MTSTSDIREFYGLDNYDDGTVFVFFKQYEEDGNTYTYVATKGGTKWYCTDGQKYKWFDLVREVHRDNLASRKIYQLSEVVEVHGEPDWEE